MNEFLKAALVGALSGLLFLTFQKITGFKI